MMDEDIEENDNYFKLDKEFQGCEVALYLSYMPY